MLALLSDLHANLRALDACLAHARVQGATRFAVLGDLVGYGAEPAAVLDRVMALAAEGAVVLRGNHDALALAPPAQVLTAADDTAAWTASQLSCAQRAFLESLPLQAREPGLMLVHASAETPQRWLYVDSARRASACLDAAGDAVRHVFVGHVHEQTVYYRGAAGSLMAFLPTPAQPVRMPAHRQWVVTVGSVGQPRDGRPEAMYALFDASTARAVFHRVPYDHLGAAAAIRAAGLPAFFADRLETGQ